MRTERIEEYFRLAQTQVYHAVSSLMLEVGNSGTPLGSMAHKAYDFTLNDDKPESLADILTTVKGEVLSRTVNWRHPLALSHMVPPPLTIAVIADALIGAINQCAFIAEEAPFASSIESACVDWLLSKVNYSRARGAGGVITSGGTASNVLALYLAIERAKLAHADDKSQYVLIATDEAHCSVEKAAAISGLPPQAIIRVKTNDIGRLELGAIWSSVAEQRALGKVPILLICTAGTTNTGAVEPVDEFLAVGKECGSWVHIDAAFGGLLALTGNERCARWCEADSISWDPHKTMCLSYSAGALLVKSLNDMEPLRFNVPYAGRSSLGVDAGALHLDGSRRLEALKLWMAIKHLGSSEYAKLTMVTLNNAQYLYTLLNSYECFHTLAVPDTNIVCFRFRPPGIPDDVINQINARIQHDLYNVEGPLVSRTDVVGNTYLRVVLSNPLLSHVSLAHAVSQIELHGARIAAQYSHSRSAEYDVIACN